MAGLQLRAGAAGRELYLLRYSMEMGIYERVATGKRASVMAYDEGLAERLRAALAGTEGVTEKKMFGGIAFMVRGNMCCGVSGDDLMVRVGPDNYAAALLRPHAREMDFTGRPLKGMAFVDAAGLESDEDLAGWARMCTDFMETLPSK